MLNSIHEVSIIVNSEKVDIYSMEKLNLRINNVVFDPVSIQSKTGEYSFSFELPATPKNNKIFNFANNSSKLKFLLKNNLFFCFTTIYKYHYFRFYKKL